MITWRPGFSKDKPITPDCISDAGMYLVFYVFFLSVAVYFVAVCLPKVQAKVEDRCLKGQCLI